MGEDIEGMIKEVILMWPVTEEFLGLFGRDSEVYQEIEEGMRSCHPQFKIIPKLYIKEPELTINEFLKIGQDTVTTSHNVYTGLANIHQMYALSRG